VFSAEVREVRLPTFFKSNTMKDEHIQYLLLRIQALTDYNKQLQERVNELEKQSEDAKLLQQQP
jgi:hypothetical protein